MIILAAAVILALSNSGIIGKANTAKLQSDLKTIQEEVMLYEQKTKLNNADATSVSVSGDDMVKLFPSTSAYKDKIKIESGKIVVNEDKFSEKEIEVAKNMGFSTYKEESGGYVNPLYYKVKESIQNKGIECTFDDRTGTVNIVLDADVKIKKSSSSIYTDEYISEKFSTGKEASLTGDFQATLDMEPVRKSFEACMDAAENFASKSVLETLLPTVPVRGKFNIEVIYDNRMQIGDIANKDKYLETGKMEGFNDEAKEIFINTRTYDMASSEHLGYNIFFTEIEVKAPTTESLQGISHNGSWGNTLVYADLKKSYQTLLKDITFELPSVTVSEDPFSGLSIYYTASIKMSGNIVVGGGQIKFNFTTKQKDGAANDYTGLQNWQTISATMALLKKASGTGGGGGGTGNN